MFLSLRHSSTTEKVRRFCVCLLTLFFAAPLAAEIGYFIYSPDFSRDFILAGDSESPARDGVAVEQSVLIFTDAAEPVELANYRYAWQLEVQAVDGSWSQVPLSGSDTHYSDSQSVFLDRNSAETPDFGTYSFSASLDPTTVLDPYRNYRIHGQLQRQQINLFAENGPFLNVESPKTNSGENLYQFTNTVSNDDARNVISTLDAATLSDPFILDGASDSDKRGFTVEVDATARRWDRFDAPRIYTFNTFRYEVVLRGTNSGSEIPLETATFNRTEFLYTYENGPTPAVPYEKSFSDTLTIVPSEQLDSVNETYTVEVTITHVENPVTNLVKTGNVRELLDKSLYHFNGALAFNDIDTVLRDFSRAPPPAPGSGSGSGYVAFNLDALEGELEQSSGHTFGPSNNVTVRLFSNGSAAVNALSTPLSVTPPTSPDTSTVAGVIIERRDLEIDTAGLSGKLTVRLPQGMGYTNDSVVRMLAGTLQFSGKTFRNNLLPHETSMTYAPGLLWVTEESKPARIASNHIRWIVESGAFELDPTGSAQSVRREETNFLRASAAPVAQKVKADNSGYYDFLVSADADASIQTAADGSARLFTGFGFSSGFDRFRTHFPRGVDVVFGSGSLTVADDRVTNGQLFNVDSLVLRYDQDCADAACPSENEPEGRFIVDVGSLAITADGGLLGAGPLIENEASDRELSWGYIGDDGAGNPEYAHLLAGFTQGTFHSSGHFVPGDGGTIVDFFPGSSGAVAAENGPGRVLLAAADLDDPSQIARPGSLGDRGGQLEYPGINLDAGDEDAIAAFARLTGDLYNYQLRDCNKFYVRRGGVTGTLEAEPDTFPEELTLLSYPFQIDYFGYGFLDSRTNPDRSFTAGSFSVPYPSDESFEFDGLALNCLGGLDSLRLPAGGLAKRLDYWQADIDIAAVDFVSSNGCDPSARAFAVFGLSAYSTLIETPLHGAVGIRPDGELIHRQFSRSVGLETEVTSRLRPPNRLRVEGPAEETYELTTIAESYLNQHELTGEQARGQGRLNFAATVDVPFFRDLKAHLRTTASKNSNPDAVLELMGGWSEAGQTYFNSNFFDPIHRAFPSAVDERTYRNATGAPGDPRPYLVNASQTWLGVVDFDYPLRWSSSLRSFEAFEPESGEQLLIVEIDHQLEYLSAENAEISFGVIYDGMPRINLSNFVFNQIDEGTGTLQAATDALREEAVGAIDDGITSLEELLSDQVDALIEDFVGTAIDPVVSELYTRLENAADTAGSASDWANDVRNQTRRYLNDATSSADTVRDALNDIASTVEDASSMIFKIDSELAKIQLALRAFHDEIYRTSGGVTIDPPATPNPDDVIRGLLQPEDGEFTIVENLVQALLAELSGEIGDELAGALDDILAEPVGELNRLVNEQLDKAEPTLKRLREVIAKLDAQISEVRAALDTGGDFLAELQSIADDASDEVDTASDEIQATVESFLLTDIPEPTFFDDYSEAEIKQRIRDEIKDRMRELRFLKEYQLVLRQKLYDIDLAIKEGVDNAFAQVNTILKDLVGEFLAELDDEINGFLGDFGDVLGAGELDGFAHINGDALRLLRIDAYLQMKVPDDLEFNGFLQIKQLESDGTGGCSYGDVGELSTEITLGAFGVPVSWLSPGMVIDVEGKVTFADKPIGLGGAFEMVEGEVGFEAFTITDLGAAMSFGQTENYLAAKVGLEFQSYALAGGIFFGKTCDIAPLMLVNEQVASVLGEPNPTFTGAYVYGEAHIPISEVLLGIPASCMFQITAGVGAGAFYFVEGPTYGGQMLLSAAGEVLCLVSVKGEVSLVGAKVADDFRFSGEGRLSGKAGACPFCIKFGKTVGLEYQNNSWDFDF